MNMLFNQKSQARRVTALIILAFCIALFQSCEKDSETSPVGGTTDRNKFIGNWITASNGTSGPLNFTMTISAGASNESQIKIANFDAEGSNTYVFGNVSGNNVSLSQTIIGNDTISGSGMYNSNNTLSFTYTIRDGQTVDNRTATAHL